MPDAARWIEVAARVLTGDDLAAARRALTDHLLGEFDAEAGARVRVDHRSETLTLDGFPRELAFDPQRWPYGVRTVERSHPLLLHYGRTGSLEPRLLLQPGETIASLPAPLVNLLRSLGIGAHQLGLPVRNEPGVCFEGYVLVRDDPFPRWALHHAAALCDLVRGLEQHLRLRASVEALTRGAADGADSAEAPGDAACLTPRERTILAMLAESRTAESIGRSLGISARTVHKHLENVYRKLGVSDRVAAVTYAQRRGLVAPAGETGDGRLADPGGMPVPS